MNNNDLEGLKQLPTERCWETYEHLERLESRYAGHMEKTRLLASTWLLATFSGLSLSVFSGVTYEQFVSCSIPLEKIASGTLVSLVGFIGIWLLRSLEVKVFRVKIKSIYELAKYLERECSGIPPIRRCSSTSSSDQKKTNTALAFDRYYFWMMALLGVSVVFHMYLFLIN